MSCCPTITRRRWTTAARFTNGSATTWDYHARGWVNGITTTVGAATLQALDYTMDAAGQTTEVTSPNPAESWSYAYDALGRLVSATSPSPGLDQSFQYDAAGNMTYNSRAGTLTYPLPGAARPHAPIEVNGEAMTYDANGNLVSGRGRTITWNARNLPVQVGTTQYAYDGDGGRRKKITPAGTSLYP